MNRSAAIAITAIVTGLFAVFFLYPAFSVIGEAFQAPDGSFTLAFIGDVFRNPVYREGLWNALALGLTSTIVTFLIAFPLALMSYRYDFAGRGILGVLILIPLVLPPFVGAIGVKHMLDVDGSLNALLINAGFRSLIFTLPNAARARFLATERFLLTSPWRPSPAIAFSPAAYLDPVWRLGSAEVNPDREKQWAPTYFGGKDQGLLVPVLVPVITAASLAPVMVTVEPTWALVVETVRMHWDWKSVT